MIYKFINELLNFQEQSCLLVSFRIIPRKKTGDHLECLTGNLLLMMPLRSVCGIWWNSAQLHPENRDCHKSFGLIVVSLLETRVVCPSNDRCSRCSTIFIVDCMVVIFTKILLFCTENILWFSFITS